MRLRHKLGIVLIALSAFGSAEVLAPAPVFAQDWDVRGGEKRRQEIISRYKKLLERNPIEGLIFEKLVAYVGRGNGLDRLVKDYEKEVEDHPEEVKYRLILGHLLKTKNDYEGALKQYEKAVELDPDRPAVWMSRGMANMLLQNDKKATADFEKALEIEDNKARKQKILRKLADIAFGQRDWDRAEKYYDQLLELDPRNEYLRMEYAQVLVKYKRYEKALEQYDELIKLAGRDTKERATTLRDKGDVYERMGAPDKAVATYRKAMKLMREGHWLHNELRHRIVDVYRSTDRIDELLAEYEKKWKYPDYDESMILAGLYDEIGKTDEALEYYRRATKKNRRKVDPRLKIIRILQRRGEDKKVLEAYKSLARVAPGQSRFQFDLVDLYFRMGDRKKAERQLKRISRRFRRDAEVYLQLADTYMRYDMRDKAQKAYERLVRLDPRNESYILSLGEFYYRASEMEKAEKTWKKLLRSRLSKPEAHALLGETYADHGLIDKGIKHYEKAVELAPDDMTIRRGIALAYARGRRWNEAVEAWSYIMDNAEQPEARAEARGRIIGLYEQQGRLRSKMREFEQAFAKEEPDVEAGYFLAEAYLKRKEYAEAEEVFEKLISLDGKKDESDLEALESLLRIYDQTNEPKKAIAVLEKLAELRPKLSREYYHRIAELSLELFQDDKAVAYANRAVEQNPNDATAHARLADVYREMQKYKLAAKEYRVAIDLDPRAFEHYFRLAELLIELGNFDEAESLYRTIVQKSNDESLILKSGRKAMKLAEADGRLEELEMEFSPLVFAARDKPVYGKLMLEIYDRLVSPLVTEVRYGVAGERDKTREKLEELGRRALPVLVDALQTDDVSQRALAIRLLGDLRAGPASAVLARIAVDGTNSLRSLAVMSVARIGDERASGTLIGALDHDDPSVRDMATWALGFTGGEKARKALTELVDGGQNWSQQTLAAISLGRIGGKAAASALGDALDTEGAGRSSRKVGVALVWALGRTGESSAVTRLRTALFDGDKDVRGVAAWSLAHIGDKPALQALLDAYWSDRASLREAGGRGLVQMSNGTSDDDGSTFSSGAREAAHDLQFVDDRQHEIHTSSLVESLEQEARAVEVGGSGGFISNHRDAIARTAAKKLKSEEKRVRRAVLSDLADMVGEVGFGILSPSSDSDRKAAVGLVTTLRPQLKELAETEDPVILRPTARLLGVIGNSADVSRLVALGEHANPSVRQAAVTALGHMKATDQVVAAVQKGLADDSFSVRAAAARSLGRLVEPTHSRAGAVTAALVEKLDDDFRAVREAAAQGLVWIDSEKGVAALAERLGAMSFPVKLVALRALSESGSKAASEALAPYREHSDIRLRRAAGGR